MSTLEVCLYGEPIGHLQRRGAGAVFEPTPEWRWSRFQPLLGLSWLQGAGTRSASEGLPVWFEALLPDIRSELRTELARDKGLDPRDSFALLASIGTDLPGAVRVRFLAPDDAPYELPERPTPIGSLHFSLAGAQLKFSLVQREDNKLVLPVHGEEGHFIAKIANIQYRSLPYIEHVTLRWAAACGHETTAHRLQPLAEIGELQHLEEVRGEQCLLVTRFDRSPSGPIHQEDFCQVFSIRPTNRYSDSDPRQVMTFSGLTRFVRDACGAEPGMEFARRVAFTLASGNTDAHLQNWSLLLPKSGPPRLAPLYDQLSVITFPPYGWDRATSPTLALPFGGVRAMADVDRELLARYAAEAGDRGLVSVFLDALTHARDAWKELSSVALPAHRAAIATQWERVPLLASL